MNNKDLWKQHEEYTKDLTVNLRNLGFAAAAIAWMFKTSENTFPAPIVVSLKFVVAFFIADILQYFIAALLIRIWTRRQEAVKWRETGTIEGEYDKPAWLDYPAFTLWVIKIVCLLIGYICIGVQVFQAPS